MKAQKLGLVLGMNMAVACLVFQGCKVTQPGGANVPPPAVDPALTVAEPAPAATTEPAPAATVATAPSTSVAPKTSAIEVSTVSEPVVEPQQPSQVATVKPLPTAKKHPVAAVPPAAPTAPVAEGAASTVVVQRGDTLSAICVRNHVKMSAVVAANPGLNPNRIRVGQKIAIPGGVAVAAAPAAKPATVMNASAPAANTTAPVKTKSAFKAYEGPTKEYKVRSGDSLGKIAYSNGITIRALKELNKLSSDTVRVGQTLLIPAEKVVAAKPASEKPAAKVAKKAPVAKADPAPKAPTTAPVTEKKDAAEVPPPVTVAEPVAAPAAEPAPAPAADAAAPAPAADAAPADAAPATSGQTYTVKEGDDIVGVAIAWGISPSQLMDLNNLKAGEAIVPGQVLKLPANAKQNGQ